MKWSWTIGRIAGIKLRVHATFLILLAWLALVDYRVSGTVGGAIAGVIFTLALFGSVVLHELGHAMMARRFGVPTRDVTLLPIGGVARLEYIPDKPKQELLIALAGPAVTLLIIVVLAAGLSLAGQPPTIPTNPLARRTLGVFLTQLMWVNVGLLAFNLLPAFPMDGGRLLRAVLALRMSYDRATELAARIGRGFALVFGLVGLLYNPFLVLIALFIWISAAAEAAEQRQRSALSGIRVDRVMVRDISTLAPTDTLQTALQHVLTGFQHDFPVIDGNRLVGVLTRSDFLTGLARRGTNSSVAASMETSFITVDAGTLVTDALRRLRECRCTTLPVLSAGSLVGMLTAENIAEYVMIEAALRAPNRQPPPGGFGRPHLGYPGRA